MTEDRTDGASQVLDSESQAARKRRWRQFSIRSLLLAAAVFALVVGTWLNRVRTQKHAVAQLRNLGGRVQYETGALGSLIPESIRQRFGEDYYARVASVGLHYRIVNRKMVTPSDEELDRAVAAIAKLPHATRLTLHSLELDDDDLARLSPIKHQIKALSINELFHYEFKGSGVRHLGNWPELGRLSVLMQSSSMTEMLDLRSLSTDPKLEDLTIGSGTLEERTFQQLATIKSLKTLCLFACRFEGDYLKHLRQLPNLRTISIHNSHPEVGYAVRGPDASIEFAGSSESAFRYEQTPQHGLMWPRKNFPNEKYQQWLQATLPDVKVYQFFSS